MIQDFIMSAMSVLFSYSLIPQIVMCIKNPATTKGLSYQPMILTGCGLLVYAVCMFSIGMYLSSVCNVITGTCWLILLVLVLKIRNK